MIAIKYIAPNRIVDRGNHRERVVSATVHVKAGSYGILDAE